jgi:plastocyanin domain-containing protein
MRASHVALGLCLALVACKKGDAKSEAPATAPPQAAAKKDGPRVVAIEAGKDGYVPDKIPGKPGEKLDLQFTRTVDGDCLAQVKLADGKTYDLPKGSPVDVPVTVPTTGQLTFVCSMDMFKGVIVADTN